MQELATEQDLLRQATLPPTLKLKSLVSVPTFGPVSAAPKDPFRKERKLVLCFDGTSNEFRGDGTDTNILKIYGMLDKSIPEQYHYYQPGIGTYVAFDSLARTDKLAALRAKGAQTLDLMFGTSVSEHVLGGYKFLMRYWAPGDQIYIFGFSRGAYTARFLAEMLDHIGLLPHGNEELVGFAWKIFSDWQRRAWTEPKETNAFWKKYFEPKEPSSENGAVGHSAVGEKASKAETTIAAEEAEPPKYYKFLEYLTLKPRRDKKNRDKAKAMYLKMEGFKRMFSRDMDKIRFLGLFDTVSSVPQFDVSWMTRGGRFAYAPRSNADEIWHAVSVDERRICFRANLMYQSPPRGKCIRSGVDDDEDHVHDNPNQKVREVWFPGNHGDVGGGWGQIKKGTPATSHLPLVWMVRAAYDAGVKFSDQGLLHEGIVLERPGAPVLSVSAASIVTAPQQQGSEQKLYDIQQGIALDDLHDCIVWGKGLKWKAVGWHALQVLPIKIMEYLDGGWKPTVLRRRPHRTIPRHEKTRIHASVFHRMQQEGTDYDPKNLPGCNELGARRWWQHGPFGRVDETGFSYDDWELALDEHSGTDYVSLIFKMKDGKHIKMPQN